MEIETKESRKLRIDKSFEMIEWLTRHCLTLIEAAIVLRYMEEGKSLAEGIMYVYELRLESKDEKNEKLTFNGPGTF